MAPTLEQQRAAQGAGTTEDLIGYDPVVKIKGQRVDIGGRWFPDFDHARLHALDYVLDIFEEEQKIIA